MNWWQKGQNDRNTYYFSQKGQPLRPAQTKNISFPVLSSNNIINNNYMFPSMNNSCCGGLWGNNILWGNTYNPFGCSCGSNGDDGVKGWVKDVFYGSIALGAIGNTFNQIASAFKGPEIPPEQQELAEFADVFTLYGDEVTGASKDDNGQFHVNMKIGDKTEVISGYSISEVLENIKSTKNGNSINSVYAGATLAAAGINMPEGWSITKNGDSSLSFYQNGETKTALDFFKADPGAYCALFKGSGNCGVTKGNNGEPTGYYTLISGTKYTYTLKNDNVLE